MLRKVTDREFKKFAELVYKKSGINLASHKKTLLESRTNKILRQRDIPDFSTYYQMIEDDSTGKELADFINVISTNTTFFFREPKHFEFVEKHVTPQLNTHKEKIKVWCAASSTGQEPYSIMMTFAELVDINRFHLTATDIDTNVLATAKKAVYEVDNCNIPNNLLKKYFQRGVGNSIGKIKVKKAIRNRVDFKPLNLIHNFHFEEQFDIIFCRNVFIYFDSKTKENIVRRMFQFVKPGGYLFIGHSESLNSLNHQFQYIMPATYQRVK